MTPEETAAIRQRLQSISQSLRDDARHGRVVAQSGDLHEIADAFEVVFTALDQLTAEHARVVQELETERSRFASWAETLEETLVELEVRGSSDWGHLRHRVLSQLYAAVKEFRRYANGAPSPSNYRKRAEKAEAELAAARARAGANAR